MRYPNAADDNIKMTFNEPVTPNDRRIKMVAITNPVFLRSRK